MHQALVRRYRRKQRYHQQSGGLLALRFGVGLATMLIFGLILSVVAVFALGVGVYTAFVNELPSAEEIGRLSVETFETTRIYDRTGETLLYELIPSTGGRRTWVPLGDISPHLQHATVAMEDKTFYDTGWRNFGGINWEGIGRAAVGVLRDEYAGGGSSIHQQLVRNVIMTPEERMERSYTRKVKEMVLAFELSRRYPGMEGRDLILEWYLNNIFYGQFAFGIEAAAQTYFGVPASELSLAQAAMLVPLPNSPALNPISDPESAKMRQEVVLDQMYLQGYITEEEAWAAKQEPLVIAPPGFDMEHPHFVLYVRDLLEEQYGQDAVYGGGLNVITTIDLELEDQVQEIAREHVDTLRAERNANNAAVVVLDTQTAEILAMVGSLDYNDEAIDGNINMAISPRQPGSSFKPFTYATAFMHGYTPATMVMDVRTSFPDPPNPAPYVPENYSRNFHGPMLLRQALACSFNIPAVAMMHEVGSDAVVDTAHRMGINTLRDAHYGLSLTLGGGEVQLLDMVYAFSVFANGGAMLGEPVPTENVEQGFRRLDPVAILKVTDAKGNVIHEYKEPRRQEVIPPTVAYQITDILSDNTARAPAFGVDNVLKLEERPAAAKTGTTNDYHDGWTIGYTPQYVTGVWVGNTDYSAMENASGVRAAGPIWHNVMQYLHDGKPVENFDRPTGLVTEIVDGTSGKLPTEYSPWRVQEIFVEGTVPTEPDDIHVPITICRTTGKLATMYCPEHELETQVYEIYPLAANDWVRENEIPQPPTDYCDAHGPNLTRQDVAITSPSLFEIISDTVPVMGNVKPGSLQQWQLQYSEGMTEDPGAWQPVGAGHGHRVDNGILEMWDTTGMDGLYSLRLSVTDGGMQREAVVPVIVDNISPTVMIVSPAEGEPDYTDDVTKQDRTFEMKKDEWINIQVYATDNTSMERVEFFMDDESLGYTTVAPYTLRWNLAMSNTVPSVPSHDLSLTEPVEILLGDRIERTEVISQAEGAWITYTKSITVGEQLTVTQVISSPEAITYRIEYPTGRTVISDTGGFTETHVLHVVAHDAAGNQQKSEPVIVYVIPEKTKDKEARLLNPEWLGLVPQPRQRPLA